jgi:hypothetical protein
MANYTIRIQRMMRYTYVQLEGAAEIKVLTSDGEVIANHK